MYCSSTKIGPNPTLELDPGRRWNEIVRIGLNLLLLEHPRSRYCVIIFDNDGSVGACQVYGTIVLIDGDGANFNLYDRGEADAETVTVGGSLTLIMPKGHAMCASGRIYLQVQLNDATMCLPMVFTIGITKARMTMMWPKPWCLDLPSSNASHIAMHPLLLLTSCY
ncbi:unnamed protein product [Cuscuta campestris]|uniref:Uncharacterized protein n=1 Tax=Cuscuta campestris TaxID=132261 RepID=A0A484JYW1_9ASTE|nr:unnamed protein product [Cuscuta campestris]